MKLPQMRKFKWNYTALSFAVPVIAWVGLMIVAGYTPFGDSKSLLYSDMWHQYYPFFKAYRSALLSGDSLLYSWNAGMGMDYLGLISYYLASPLNLLSVLIPEGWTLQYFSLLVPLKLGFAGMFFAIFLKKIFGKDDISLPLFGGFYAMCSWALGYHWNLMWLDSFALLPLVVLGTVTLLRDKKFVLYTVSLFLAVAINYYTGFFVCIFVLLVFICYQICRWSGIKRFCQDFVRIGIFTVLAIGMTLCVTMPALAALQNTQSSVNKYPDSFAVNIVSGTAVNEAKTAWSVYKTAVETGEGNAFSLFFSALGASIGPLVEGMKKVAGNMNGGIIPTFKEGLPNVYSGVGTIFFAALFLTSPKVKSRDKACSVLLLVFFALSFILRQLDYIWHGFHFTNMIPYRFSFLFSFVMLYMAYRAYLERENLQIWQLLVAGLLSVAVMLCYDKLTDPVYLTYNIVFLVLYLGTLVYAWVQTLPADKKFHKAERQKFLASQDMHRKIASVILAGVLGLELILNTVNFGVNFTYTSLGNYPKGLSHTENVIDYMYDNDQDLFYRAEVTHSQTLNDGPLNGYNGISTFTSSANVKVTEFIKALGYSAKNTYNRYCFEESSPVANLFLNLKYMIERDGQIEENPYFTDIYNSDKVHLLQNNAYLPLGFLAEKELAELKFSSTNAFTFQNQLFRAATGLDADVWTLATQLAINPNGTNMTSKSEVSGYSTYKNGASQTTAYYRYTADREGFFCLDMNLSARNNYTVWKNGQYLYSEGITLPQTLAVCQVKPGDTIELHITCKANESGTLNIRAAIMNDAVFQQGYKILSASTLQLTEFSNTKVAGTITCDRDGLLYTSIPQNGENWTVTVDGKEADIVLVGDVMIGVQLTEGQHEIRFTYRNSAFTTGLLLSLGCFVIFAAIIYVVYFHKKVMEKLAQRKSNTQQ